MSVQSSGKHLCSCRKWSWKTFPTAWRMNSNSGLVSCPLPFRWFSRCRLLMDFICVDRIREDIIGAMRFSCCYWQCPSRLSWVHCPVQRYVESHDVYNLPSQRNDNKASFPYGKINWLIHFFKQANTSSTNMIFPVAPTNSSRRTSLRSTPITFEDR